tara:strand:+ start:444 stop:1151 length:708 start_codon:yes stop_codon:yes gene_type:complete
MNRKLILDTETTGLDFDNDRIIEVGCVELIDEIKTGVTFHKYYNPGDRVISEQAEQIHGLNNRNLENFGLFENELEEFLEFIQNSSLVIHNAQFDLTMINNALKRKNREIIDKERCICTLEMARKKFPGGKNNLNALCRKFDISLENRIKHGALTDCNLLSEVYIELEGGRQNSLTFSNNSQEKDSPNAKVKKNYESHAIKISSSENKAHSLMLKKLKNPIWLKIRNYSDTGDSL